jgi:hypothetical protein
VAGLAASRAREPSTAACATPCVPTESSTPPLTTPAATARTCTKHMKIVLFCVFVRVCSRFGDDQESLVSVRPNSYPSQRQLCLACCYRFYGAHVFRFYAAPRFVPSASRVGSPSRLAGLVRPGRFAAPVRSVGLPGRFAAWARSGGNGACERGAGCCAGDGRLRVLAGISSSRYVLEMPGCLGGQRINV